MGTALAERFVSLLGRGEASTELEEALREALGQARARWSDVSVDDLRFVEELGRRLPPESEPVSGLRAMSVVDVYLAVGCLDGAEAALKRVEADFVPHIRGILGRMGFTGSEADEALQVMRSEMFVAAPGRPAGITGYAGRGSLRGWLNAVSARIALRATGRAIPELFDEASLDHATEQDPELDYLRRVYGEAFQKAFREALAGLSARQRLLLRQRFRHQLGIDEMGRLYGVHHSTVSRWVTEARERLVGRIRETMMAQFNLGRPELSSVMRLIDSEVDLTLSSVAPDAGDGE